ncbi:MAG: hypothetical protein K2L27_05245 [Muribaculaceae bacterium]|nr:hypothetical protein [Muribaculaceae bacterium]
MKKLFSVAMLLLVAVATYGARHVIDFNRAAPGQSYAFAGSGSGTATVVQNPAGAGLVVRVQCAAYNGVPQFDVSLPDGLTLGDCTSVGAKIYIPSGGNEQYAHYKQLQVYVDGALVFKNTKPDGSDEYPNQGDKDKWLTKTVGAADLKLDASQKALSEFAIAVGLNDDKMTYYIAELIFAYDLNLPEPELPAQGAFVTGRYRNLFAEAGYSEAQVQQRIDELWATYFEGDKDTERLYYESGSDMAYILDVNNADVRTEGMSYGMMLCVQLDRKKEFDALWKWAKTYMQYPSDDERRGYFSWQCNTDGSKKGGTPASDGEEYFVTALMFASGRWGDGTGIYAYSKEANYILDMCMEKPAQDVNPYSSVTPLFDPVEKQVVFVPYASAAKFTDPSYHVPAFYELWARWAGSNREFYAALAAKSREMWPKFAHPVTGLMPDYAEFSGAPHNGDGDHADFLYDAWRCIMNMAIDYAWFKPDGVPYTELVGRMYKFFLSKGIADYHSIYTLDGQDKNGNTDHSPGLVACNASGALACDSKDAWAFIENFYDTAIPTGRYRYYDGCLYFLNWLNCAGRYRIYGPGVAAGASDAVADLDSDAPAVYYDLRGMRLGGTPTAPGIYIRKQNENTQKILVK